MKKLQKTRPKNWYHIKKDSLIKFAKLKMHVALDVALDVFRLSSIKIEINLK